MTAFIAAVIVAGGVLSTVLFLVAHTRNVEREVRARGIALAEALARAVNEGLAAEKLNLIKQVEDIVHVNDVVLTQVFSTSWNGIAAVPRNRLNDPPAPSAIAYFKKRKSEQDFFSVNEGHRIDIYKPVFFDPRDPRIDRRIFVGYVRLTMSTEPVGRSFQHAMVFNVFALGLLTLGAIVALNAILSRYILKPVLNLHSSASRFRFGELPDTVPVYRSDELGELSAEFNEMIRALRDREENLAEEKERLAVTLRSIGDAVIVTDVEGTVTLLNKVADDLTGWKTEEAVGSPLSEVFHIINEKTRKRCENPVTRVMQTGRICGLTNHTALLRKDGSEIIIEDSAAPVRDRNSRIIGVVLVFRDTTEKRRIAQELLKTEKLQSVGVLAGGLAHDFNNLLTAVLGNISVAKMYIDTKSKAHERLKETESAARRAADLTARLLTFSRGGAPIRRAAAIGDIIRESTGFTLAGTKVAAEYGIPSDLWSADVDAGQISQVFSNLVINAVQAMPDGGSITITAKNIMLGEDDVPTLPDGAYVRISVVDRGSGIPGEHLSRIFDPYFTTKQDGTGLGLASVYSIVKQHGGHVAVESLPERGTTFHIYLPASSADSVAGTADEPRIDAGKGRILVMDDEPAVQEVSREMLTTLGYEVSIAENGSEALSLYRSARTARQPFHAVVMDLTIPGGMGGKKAIALLRDLDPDVRAIVSSGYSNDPVMADYRKYGFRGVIIKPYSIDMLSKALREVLQEERKP